MNKRIKGFMFAAAILASLAGCAKGTDSQSDTAVETAVTTTARRKSCRIRLHLLPKTALRLRSLWTGRNTAEN